MLWSVDEPYTPAGGLFAVFRLALGGGRVAGIGGGARGLVGSVGVEVGLRPTWPRLRAAMRAWIDCI